MSTASSPSTFKCITPGPIDLCMCIPSQSSSGMGDTFWLQTAAQTRDLGGLRANPSNNNIVNKGPGYLGCSGSVITGTTDLGGLGTCLTSESPAEEAAAVSPVPMALVPASTSGGCGGHRLHQVSHPLC